MDRETLLAMQGDPLAFRQRGQFEAADGVRRRLASCLDPWQERDFRALDNTVRSVIGVPVDESQPVYKYAYLERPRGHSKTSDIGWLVTNVLFASPRPLSVVVAAADVDQGKLDLDAVGRHIAANDLDAFLSVQSNRVVNVKTKSRLEVISSDAGSSYGTLADLVICDELTHWRDAGDQLWHSLFSTAGKRPHCALIVISNAGCGEGVSWQWRVREAARESDAWYFSRLDGPQASWISPSMLDEQRRMLPAVAFDRLWLNRWTSSTGDALDAADIEAAVTLPGPPDDWSLVPHTERPSTFRSPAFVGVDVGVRRDHTGVVALAARNGRAELLFSRGWKPRGEVGGEVGVDLADVRRVVLGVAKRYGAEVYYDPSQAEAIAQDLRANGVRATSFPFTAANTTAMANTLVSTFRERKISLWRDEALIRDLNALTITEKPNAHGYKLTARRSADGSHADVAFAMCIALVPTMQAATDVTNDPATARAVGQFVFDQRRYMRRSPRVF